VRQATKDRQSVKFIDELSSNAVIVRLKEKGDDVKLTMWILQCVRQPRSGDPNAPSCQKVFFVVFFMRG